MPSVPTPLLTRLRHCRGMWVFCLIALVFKLATGTICLADGLRLQAAAAASVADDAHVVMTQSVADASNDDGGNCSLGEPGGCHCVCAHSLPLPSSADICHTALTLDRFDSPVVASDFQPTPTGSLFRPPIA